MLNHAHPALTNSGTSLLRRLLLLRGWRSIRLCWRWLVVIATSFRPTSVCVLNENVRGSVLINKRAVGCLLMSHQTVETDTQPAQKPAMVQHRGLHTQKSREIERFRRTLPHGHIVSEVVPFRDAVIRLEVRLLGIIVLWRPKLWNGDITHTVLRPIPVLHHLRDPTKDILE